MYFSEFVRVQRVTRNDIEKETFFIKERQERQERQELQERQERQVEG
jgi:hypothetical protein